MKENVEKLSNTISDNEKGLLNKEEIVVSLQDKLKVKEEEISNLSNQNAELLKNISKFSVDIEEGQKMLNDKLSSSTAEFDSKLKEKDQVFIFCVSSNFLNWQYEEHEI